MTSAVRHTRRFAPLDPARTHESDAPQLKGIVFDVDGTLWYVTRFSQDIELLMSRLFLRVLSEEHEA